MRAVGDMWGSFRLNTTARTLPQTASLALGLDWRDAESFNVINYLNS